MERLNDIQKKAILTLDKVVLVIAGAGSGKTTVLTKRIEYLITEKQVNPSEILAITFTNKAVNEMKERLKKNLGPHASNVWVMTFHAFSMRVIRENLKFLPYHKQGFLIIDDSDKKRIIKDILKRLSLTDYYKVPQVMWAINKAKTFSNTHSDAKNSIDFEFLDVYVEYERYLNDNNAMDFDDLLIYCYELLQIEVVNDKYKNRFKYIHVDEYQDTSEVQALMLSSIKSSDASLFVVGDVDQAIYGWRGAKVENIMGLEESFKKVNVIKLEQNYRSTKNIVKAANNLIINNDKRYDKNLWTDNDVGEKVKVQRFNSASDEAEFIYKEIDYLMKFGKNTNDIAILYRYNYQSKKLEESLMRGNIPYVIYGGIRFYERMEIKDMIAYLRLILNSEDNISFLRIINSPKRAVGEATLAKIRGVAIEQSISYFEASKFLASTKIKQFNDIIFKYKNCIETNFLEFFEEFLDEIKYEEYLLTLDEKPKVDERIDNINELKYAINEAIKNGSSLSEYLNEILIFSEKQDDSVESVVMSTIHGVKGLEFDYVFLTGMNEGKFPKHHDIINFEELEEDRRVAYVAITRASKKLVISNISYDYTGQYLEDSRFIEEMGIENTIHDKEGFIF
ncbi:MAG: ATP-dependent helicase [Mycoplasmatales bacterium]